MTADAAGTVPVNVCEQIRRVRDELGVSLQELGQRTGYSTAVLSQIENHLISPSLGTMIILAKALNVPIGRFLGHEDTEPFTIIRRDERQTVSRFESREGFRYGYTYESLGVGKRDRKMEPFCLTMEPATLPSGQLSSHEGEEFIYVLEGSIDVTLWQHTDVLAAGDSIYYDSTIPHRVCCHGDEPARILAVIHP
ncbi:MAG: cupin domain-containing protein [Deltaproteobacteria bacterium]|nr:cupin domain-containing protein [Candidatus Anaeroferrophillacea bacterium]